MDDPYQVQVPVAPTEHPPEPVISVLAAYSDAHTHALVAEIATAGDGRVFVLSFEDERGAQTQTLSLDDLLQAWATQATGRTLERRA